VRDSVKFILAERVEQVWDNALQPATRAKSTARAKTAANKTPAVHASINKNGKKPARR
jgi:hypothetical protein